MVTKVQKTIGLKQLTRSPKVRETKASVWGKQIKYVVVQQKG